MHRDSFFPDSTPHEPGDRPPPSPGRDVMMTSAFLVMIVLLAYRPSLHSEFVHLDDYQYVVDNELVREPNRDGAFRFFTEVSRPSTVDGYYQPLTMISLMLDASLSGATMQSVNPFIFHLTNILLHAATTVLVFLWVRTFLGGLYLPFFAALLFALHPAQVEAVSWISQRKTVLATLLAVAAIIAYVEWVRFHARWWLAASVALYLLATLAKPTTVLLPLVLPLIDLWPLGRRPLASLRDKWPFLPILVAMSCVSWSSQSAADAALAVPHVTSGGDVARWVGLLSYNAVLYAGNLLWPMHLSPYRALPDPLAWSSPAVLLSVLGMAAILIVWIASWWYSKPLFSGLSAFGLLLAPTLGAIRFMGSCVADRFLYLPFFFLLLPLAYGLDRAKWRLARPAVPFIALILLMLPFWILTRAQQGVWANSKSLWTHVAESDPTLAKAHANLALIGLGEGDFAKALDHAKKAHDFDPGNAANLHVLGRAYVRRGLANKAVPLIEQALAKDLGPNQASGYVALGEALICEGDKAGAQAAVQKAVAKGYPVERAYSELGDVAHRFAARYDLAEDCYRRAVDAEPEEAEYHWKLAATLDYLGRHGEALQQCEEALRLSTLHGEQIPEILQRSVERLRLRAASRPAQE